MATTLSTDHIQTLKNARLLRGVFSNSMSASAKCHLYTSLVRSQLLYCSVIWRPHLLVDIKCLELVQRRATKFVIKDTTMNYKDRLTHLHLLPLMMNYEIADIIFFIKSLKFPSEYFNIHNFVKFSGNPTRSTYLKLRHPICKNQAERNFYFNRIWNSLPPLDLNLSLGTIKSRLRNFFWSQFVSNFYTENFCTYHYLCPCQKCSKLPISMHFSSSIFFFSSFLLLLFCFVHGCWLICPQFINTYHSHTCSHYSPIY